MNNVKFQYLRSENYDSQKDGLCITLGTEIIDSERHSHVFWSVAFKNPKDQFVKEIARNVVMDNFQKIDFVSGEHIFKKGDYTRTDIVAKILMDLYINSSNLTKDYKNFVSHLICEQYYPSWSNV